MLLATRRIFNKVGIDRAIAYSLSARVVQAVGGVGTIYFIARYLSKDEQGYYYTFNSLVGLQIFFELGLNNIITQFVAHEMAHLQLHNGSIITGEDQYKSRLSSLLHFCVKWFSIISVLLFAVLLIVGFYFFSSFHKTTQVSWEGPWILLAISTCFFLFISPILAFLEGLGKVKEVAHIRFVQQVIAIVSIIILLLLHFGLYSGALTSLLCFFAVFITLLYSINKNILQNIWKGKGAWKINYRKEVFPFQWRIALSWICGYFIYQLFNPVIFATDGPVVAGQTGMTLAVLVGITNISMSWINTKVPLFSSLISRKEYKELDKKFFKSLYQSLLISGACLLVYFTIVGILKYFDIPIGKRFLPMLPLVLFGSTTFANHLIFSLSTYVRCHKKEPFLIYSVIIAILCSLSTFILGKFYGVNGISIGYCFLTFFVSLPWVYYIFLKKRELWHNNHE